MTARRLVLLRHGRTEWNALKRIQGQSDIGLDDRGDEQAREVAPVLAKLQPAALWSSDLTRARQTTGHLAGATGLEPTYDARLREFHIGELQGLTHAELVARDPQLHARFQAGEWDELPGGETRAEVAARFTAVLHDVAGELAPGQTGVVVSHGAAVRVGIMQWLGWPVERAWEFGALGNCAWVELVERASGRWTLAAYNRTI